MKVFMRVIDWGLKAACFAVLLYFAVIRGAEPVQLVQATRGLFESRVNSTDGVIQSKTRYTVTAFADGKIKRPNFKVGDTISQGAVVVEILVGQNYENIRAAVSGVVSKVYRENGGDIERKEPILEISDPEHMEMFADLSPAEAEQVHNGDDFTVTKWGGSEPIKGTVTHISHEDSKSDKVRISGVIQEVPQDIFKKLGNRTQVDVSIQVAKFPDALKLPIGAVFRDKDNWAVFKVVDHKAREKKVTIVNKNNEEMMIGQGLSEGELVINGPGALIKDGVRVEMQALKQEH